MLTLALLLIAWAAAREPRHPSCCAGGDRRRRLPDDAPEPASLEPASPLQRVQFPWRLNLVLALATVAVVALGTQPHRLWQGLWWGVFLLTLLSTLAYVRHAP